jgi:radical SAM protein with 4Fe4S-binding SPASM domain
MLYGLTHINIELNSTCDKGTLCAFCGHQDPAIHPTRRDGEMSKALLADLAADLEPLGKHLVVQFHRDGDPLAASTLGWALQVFSANTRSLVTHGEGLARRADEIIRHCEAVTVSIFRGDPDRDKQVAALTEFVKLRAHALPQVYLKVVGGMSDGDFECYAGLGLPVLSRRLHLPESNRRYTGGLPPMPEHGLCLDLLSHPSVAWDGRVYVCNRLDATGRGCIGDLKHDTLDQIWNGPIRAKMLLAHRLGQRAEVPACATCTYYGVPAT